MIVTLRGNNCCGHFGGVETGILLFEKTKEKFWVNELIKLNTTELSQFGHSPSYKLLQLKEDEFGLLIFDENYGNNGYFYYVCELHSFENGKVFTLNTLNDTTGAKEKNESIELIKKVFTQKIGKQYNLCVGTKGIAENRKRVNKVECFSYQKEYNYYIPFKTIYKK